MHVGTCGSPGSPCVSVRIADLDVSIACPSDAFAATVSSLLVNHLRSDVHGSQTVLVQVRIGEPGPAVEAASACAAAGKAPDAWIWRVPSATAADLPNRLYYRSVLPMLVQVLASRGALRMHAALLATEWSGPILMLGPSGAGKSSTAAGWGLAGEAVLADDTVFLRETRGGLACHGLRRPLHLSPDVLPHVSALPGLSSATEYLPGRAKVAYDPWRMAGTPVVDRVSTPALVLASSVTSEARSRLTLVSRAELGPDLAEAAAPEGAAPPVSAAALEHHLRHLRRCVFARVYWGEDVWEHPLLHPGVLRELLGAVRTRRRARPAPAGAVHP